MLFKLEEQVDSMMFSQTWNLNSCSQIFQRLLLDCGHVGLAISRTMASSKL